METSGRERRHRYFTVANYLQLVLQEELDKNSAGYADVDLNEAGGFQSVKTESFYEAESELVQYANAFKDNDQSRVPKTRKVVPKNPILPNGKVKRGRPRKIIGQKDDTSLPSKSVKRKVADAHESQVSLSEQSEEPQKKKTRSMIEPLEQIGGKSARPFCAKYCTTCRFAGSVIKRGRGRPRKVPARSSQESSVHRSNSPLPVSECRSPDASLEPGPREDDILSQVTFDMIPATPHSNFHEQVVRLAGVNEEAASLANTGTQGHNRESSLLLFRDDSVAEYDPAPLTGSSDHQVTPDISNIVATNLGSGRASSSMAPNGEINNSLPHVSNWEVLQVISI